MQMQGFFERAVTPPGRFDTVRYNPFSAPVAQPELYTVRGSQPQVTDFRIAPNYISTAQQLARVSFPQDQQQQMVAMNLKREIDALQARQREMEVYIQRLEGENKNLQYELQEVAVHLNSYKDRFEQFQRMDLKSNKETNDYLCNQIERLTEMLKQKNIENQQLQSQLSEGKNNQDKKIQLMELQLDQYRTIMPAHEQGQQYVQSLQSKIAKLQSDCQIYQDNNQRLQEQEEYWRQLYYDEKRRSEENGANLKMTIRDNTSERAQQLSEVCSSFSNAAPLSEPEQRRTTKAKLQWKQNKNS